MGIEIYKQLKKYDGCYENLDIVGSRYKCLGYYFALPENE